MNLVETARMVLERAGYTTSTAAHPSSFYFEDASLFGFVWVASSPSEILGQWEERQDAFLREKDLEMRRSGDKSWNVYSVFLTPTEAAEKERQQLSAVEEDFRGTRKVTCAGVQPTLRAATAALLPLLPVINSMHLEEIDALARLRKRVSSLPPRKVESMLGEADGKAILAQILNADENP